MKQFLYTRRVTYTHTRRKRKREKGLYSPIRVSKPKSTLVKSKAASLFCFHWLTFKSKHCYFVFSSVVSFLGIRGCGSRGSHHFNQIRLEWIQLYVQQCCHSITMFLKSLETALCIFVHIYIFINHFERQIYTAQ